MTAYVGRALTITWGGVTIGGIQTKTIKLNGQAIDITSDDAAGYRTFLATRDVRSVDLTLSGVGVNSNLQSDWQAGNTEKTLIITWPDGTVLSGTFEMQAWSAKGEHKSAITFDVEFASSGAWTWA